MDVAEAIVVLLLAKVKRGCVLGSAPALFRIALNLSKDDGTDIGGHVARGKEVGGEI